MKHEHNILKKRVLNNQNMSERNQNELHREFLQKKNKFKNKYNKYQKYSAIGFTNLSPLLSNPDEKNVISDNAGTIFPNFDKS